MENLSEFIKDVAIYLRKSRAKGIEETDETLAKHYEILVSFAKEHNFRYVIYKEVASGDSISGRPEMQKLLRDVENGLFDAVLVVDFDRLGRGNEEDSGRIKRIFKNSGTLIITPNKIYNLENEDDETFVEFLSFMSRQEYKMIRKRMLRGKKIGSKMGNWTNGTPPLGYYYNPQTKKLEVDKEKAEIYKLIKSLFLDKLLTVENIAIELNKLGIPTPYGRGSRWYGNVVQRILLNETYLGKIISNKSKGNLKKGERVIKYPRDQWIIVENCHEPLITQEEYDRILELFNQRRKIASRAKAGIYDFSGIIKCKICGHSMTYLKNKKTGRIYMKPCWYVDQYGNKCPNRSGYVDEITKEVMRAIIDYRDNLVKNIPSEQDENKEQIKLIIKQKIKQLNKFKSALGRVNDAYELGDYTRSQWLERKAKWENEINKINAEIDDLQKSLNANSAESVKDRIKALDYIIDNLQTETNPEERNKLYRLCIDKITWLRIGENEPELSIYFKE